MMSIEQDMWFMRSWTPKALAVTGRVDTKEVLVSGARYEKSPTIEKDRGLQAAPTLQLRNVLHLRK